MMGWGKNGFNMVDGLKGTFDGFSKGMVRSKEDV